MGEEEIDLAATHAGLLEIDKAIEEATREHNAFLKELGLAPLPETAPPDSEAGR